MAKEVPLTGILDAIEEAVTTEWKPILVLDPEGQSEIFFKYKASLIMAYLPGEVTANFMDGKFKHSVTRGDTCVLSIDSNDEPFHYFNPENFPSEMLEKEKLTYDFLKTYITDSNVPCSCHKDYKFVVLQKTHDIPEWAGPFHIIKVV